MLSKDRRSPKIFMRSNEEKARGKETILERDCKNWKVKIRPYRNNFRERVEGKMN